MNWKQRLPSEQIAEIETFARAIAGAGGRGLLVGGFVRDRLLEIESKDYDFEVYGLDIDALEAVLQNHGEVIAVGKSFGVLRVKGHDVDFSVPRRDNKVGKGHRGFRMELDPSMSFTEAARRRDLTINSIGLDPLSDELLDAHGGVEDLRRNRLRATDPASFAEDPLRGLRIAQFLARFEMEPDAELRALCAQLDLADLSAERYWQEFQKLFLKSRRPSLGLAFLEETGLLRFFPELQAVVGVPQDPEWHPEGTVWEHTLLVVDEAAKLREGDAERDLVLLYGALCHDLGKATTTVHSDDGHIRSPNHEAEGVLPTEQFLARIRAPNRLVEQVCVLVRHHLAPAHFSAQKTTDRGYRRLARKCSAAGVSLAFLERVARADHFGRTTPDALRREFPAGEEFIERAAGLEIQEQAVADVVLGRHLMARGLEPGPAFGKILARCREVQDETGWGDVERILARVLVEDGRGLTTERTESTEGREGTKKGSSNS